MNEDLLVLEAAFIALSGLTIVGIATLSVYTKAALGRGGSIALLMSGMFAVLWKGPVALGAGDTYEPASRFIYTLFFAAVSVTLFLNTAHLLRRHAESLESALEAERRAANAEKLALQRQLEVQRLEEENRFKTRFINTAAHELNTPITPIMLQLDLLKESRLGELNEKQAKAVDMLDRNLNRLAGLVKDMLDVARLQGGRLTIKKEAIDVADIVRHVHASFEAAARQAGVDLQLHAPERLPADVDAPRIQQVLFNLISNALKFTPAGGVVTIEGAATGREVMVRVRDTGVGLSSDQVARLFQPFSQVHDTMQKTRAGTGLGLYISRGIVDLHGGHIWCESDGPGRGCTFAFALPASHASVAQPYHAVAFADPEPARAAENAFRPGAS